MSTPTETRCMVLGSALPNSTEAVGPLFLTSTYNYHRLTTNRMEWPAISQLRGPYSRRNQEDETVKLKKPMFVFLGCLFTAIAVLGCQSDIDKTEILKLTYMEMDQSPDTGFRPIADRGDYESAASIIDTYLEGKDGLTALQKGYLHLHASQLWAFHGDDTKSIAHIEQAFVRPLPADFHQTYNIYIEGTRAFMLGDIEAVRKARDQAKAMNNLSYRDSTFLDSLEELSKLEGMTYREAAFSEPE